MKDPRALIISVLATVALLSATAGTAWANDTTTTDACAADGSADTGENAISADKDPQAAGSHLDETEAQNGNADKGTANDNNQCGENETGEKQTETAGPGTSQKGETEQTGNNDDGAKGN